MQKRPPFEGIDDAIPLPASLRARLASTIEGFDFAQAALAGVDAPMALPPAARSRLRNTAATSKRRRRAATLAYRFAVAASLVLVIATGAVLATQPGRVRLPQALGPSVTPTVTPDPGRHETGHGSVVVVPPRTQHGADAVLAKTATKALARTRTPMVAPRHRHPSPAPPPGGPLPSVVGIDLNKLVNDTVSGVLNAVGVPPSKGGLLPLG